MVNEFQSKVVSVVPDGADVLEHLGKTLFYEPVIGVLLYGDQVGHRLDSLYFREALTLLFANFNGMGHFVPSLYDLCKAVKLRFRKGGNRVDPKKGNPIAMDFFLTT